MSEFDKMSMKETRPFAGFSSKDEYLEAMVEDLADWLNFLYNLQDENQLTPEKFFEQLKDGVILCKHAHVIQSLSETYIKSPDCKGRKLPIKIGNQTLNVPLLPPVYNNVDYSKKISTFLARDNVSNFIIWSRNFNIPTSLTFETDDLIVLKNPRSVVIALLELSRIGKLFGMEVPDIIQLEQEIDDEMNRTINSDIDEMCNSDSNNSLVDVANNNAPYKNELIIKVSEDCVDGVGTAECTQFNNSAIASLSNGRYLGDSVSFGFKGRRSSANITRHDITPLFDQSENPIVPLDIDYVNHEVDRFFIDANNTDQSMRKSRSIYFDAQGSPIIIDNSDNDSNFSQSSSSKFMLPKYKTKRPVGRVKIYDNFDKSNYVKEKKTREKVDLRSLDERVREILSECQCEELFPMKRVSEGRYQWGDKKSLIFVRILRTHVMVRVGGGWDTLSNFLSKHDSCRKGKCDRFKFCLPALNKKPSAQNNEIPSNLKPSTTLPSNLYNFKQGMMTFTNEPRRNSDYGNAECNIVKEGNNEVVAEKGDASGSVHDDKIRSLSDATLAPLRLTASTNNNSLKLPNKFRSEPTNESSARLRPRDVQDHERGKCLSMELINSPKTLAEKFEIMCKERYDDEGLPRPTRAGGATTKIPVLRLQKRK